MTPEQHAELLESIYRLQVSLAEMSRNLGDMKAQFEVKVRGDQLVLAIRREQKRTGRDPLA